MNIAEWVGKYLEMLVIWIYRRLHRVYRFVQKDEDQDEVWLFLVIYVCSLGLLMLGMI